MLVIRLSTKLDFICVSNDAKSTDSDQEPSAAYAHSILRTLADAVAKKVELGHADVSKYVDRLVPRLYHLHIYSSQASNDHQLIGIDPRLLAVSAEIITLVLQTVSVE